MLTLYKMLVIAWSERSKNPLRIFAKSYARARRFGYYGMLKRLNAEYYPLTVGHKITDRKYSKWIKKNEVENSNIEYDYKYEPIIAIISYIDIKSFFLEDMLQSVLGQIYKEWRLYLVCIGNELHDSARKVLDKYVDGDCVRKVRIENSMNKTKSINMFIEQFIGDYVVFLNPNDSLSKNALLEIVRSVNSDRELKMIYSDEDSIDSRGIRFNPHFKSDYNADMLLSFNYIGNLLCVKKSTLREIGYLREKYKDGMQYYDLLLRMVGKIKESEIYHVPKVLYHSRICVNMDSSNGDGNGNKEVLKEYFCSCNQNVLITDGLIENTYRVCYSIPKNLPKVSIIIPTKDHCEVLSKCLDSILRKTTYNNFEIIVVNNQSEHGDTLEFLRDLKERCNAIKVVEYSQEFNYSAINNFAVSQSGGDVLVLMNNDVEIITQNWLEEIVSQCLRKEIGAVGAKLYYPNDRIQHAGVVLGVGGVAGHSYKYCLRNDQGYFGRLMVAQNYSAVTGALLGVRKEIYCEVGGLSEELAVAFNDVDFCLKLLKAGYRNLWTPYVEAYHYESYSRGIDDTSKKRRRLDVEINYMYSKWGNLNGRDKYFKTAQNIAI